MLNLRQEVSSGYAPGWKKVIMKTESLGRSTIWLDPNPPLILSPFLPLSYQIPAPPVTSRVWPVM